MQQESVESYVGGRGYWLKGGAIMSETSRLTSELLWRATSITALIDVVLLLLVARFVSAELFAKLKWHVAAACIVYALLWGVLGSVLFWDTAYNAVFPGWSRWLLPVGFGLLYGVLALAFWQVSIHAPRWQAVLFCLLGGGMSLVGHGIGITRGLLRVPLLAQTNMISILSFGVTEFIVYWCVIVGLGMMSRRLGLALHLRPA
jgi:hypothetical protein